MEKTVKEYLKIAKALIEGNQLVAALENLNIAIELEPDNFTTWYDKGGTLFNLKRYDEALTCFDKVIELNHLDDFKVWFNKGRILGALDRYDEALTCFDKAIDLDSDDYNAWFLKGITLLNLNRLGGEVLVCFDKATDLCKDNSKVWFFKGKLLFDLNRYQESLVCFNRATDLNTNDFLAWFLKSNTQLELHQYADAAISLTKGDESLPKDDASLNDWIGEMLTILLTKGVFVESTMELSRYSGLYYPELARQCGLNELLKIEQFRELFSEIVNYWKYSEAQLGTMNTGYLYQYAQSEVLIPLAENKQFRLSPALYQNDPLEGKILFKFLQNTIDPILQGDAKDELLNIYEQFSQNLKNILSDGYASDIITFIRSFTTLEDSLVMWNSSYGGYGAGIAVGLSYKNLKSKCGTGLQGICKLADIGILTDMQKGVSVQPEDYTTMPLKNIGLYKINYIDPKDMLEVKLSKITRLLNDFFLAYINYPSPKSTLEDMLDMIVKLFLPLSHIVKQKHFEHENEYRLIHIATPSRKESMRYVHSTLLDGLYIQTETCLFSEEDITKVFLGPKMDNLVKLKIKDALKQQNIAVELNESSIDFR